MRGEWRELERRREAADAWPGRVVAVFVLAMLGVVGWKRFASEDARATTTAPELEAAITAPPTVERPPVVESPVPLYQERPPTRSGRESYVGVYECTVNGQRVVSDKPCGGDARARTLVIDQPDPREVARQRQMTQSAGRSGSRYYASPPGGSSTSSSMARAGSTATASNEAACEAVDRAIENVNARMRQRYGAAEGERLRAQWHAIKQQRYDLKCGR